MRWIDSPLSTMRGVAKIVVGYLMFQFFKFKLFLWDSILHPLFIFCRSVPLKAWGVLELLIDFGVDITLEGYIRLARCLNHYVTRLRPNNRNDGSCADVQSSFVVLKKPGKKIRLSLVKCTRKKFLLADQKFCKSWY
jgi:hypothetical protein